MNKILPIDLGSKMGGERYSVDLAQLSSPIILLLGQSGSGKSVIHYHMYRQLFADAKQTKLNMIIIDNTRVDFNGWLSPFIKFNSGDSKLSIAMLEKVVNITKKRISFEGDDNDKLIVIHIEECDLAIKYTDRFFDAIKALASAKRKNVYVVYSTSRISDETVPDWLLEEAGMKIVFGVNSVVSSQRLTGSDEATHLNTGEKYIILSDGKQEYCQALNNEELEVSEQFKKSMLQAKLHDIHPPFPLSLLRTLALIDKKKER